MRSNWPRIGECAEFERLKETAACQHPGRTHLWGHINFFSEVRVLSTGLTSYRHSERLAKEKFIPRRVISPRPHRRWLCSPIEDKRHGWPVAGSSGAKSQEEAANSSARRGCRNTKLDKWRHQAELRVLDLGLGAYRLP